MRCAILALLVVVTLFDDATVANTQLAATIVADM